MLNHVNCFFVSLFIIFSHIASDGCLAWRNSSGVDLAHGTVEFHENSHKWTCSILIRQWRMPNFLMKN